MSNLLEKASIVTTPTAYDDGKILSVKPEEVLGEELVVNGDFSDGANNWTLGTGWSIGENKAVSDNSGSGSRNLRQNGISTSGKNYKITFEADVTSGIVYLIFGGTTAITASGTYTFYKTANGSDFQLRNSVSNFIGSITNVSVKEEIDGDFDFTRNSSATRVNSQGLIEDVQILSGNLVSNGDFSQEGSELITNGDFSNGSTDWTLGTGWSIGANKVIGDGTMGGNDVVRQIINFSQGTTYRFSFTVLDYVSGGVFVRNPFNGYLDIASANGSYSFDYVAGINDYIDFRGNSFIGSVTNVSVKEVGQDWTLSSAWNIGTNKAIFSDTIGGDIRTSSSVFTANKKYQIKLTVADLTSGTAFFGVGDGAANNLANYANYANGEHTFNVTAPIGQELRIYSTTSSGSSYSISNISVIEITEDTNLPRIDYTGCGSWLFEPQSTNEISYSEDFSNAYWSKLGSPTVTLNYGVSPSGQNNSVRIQGNSSTVIYNAGSFSATDGRSMYVKATSGSGNIQLLSHTANTDNVFSIDENWKRVEINTTAVSASTFYAVDMRGASTDIFDIEIWGAQIEQLSYATSYIPTEGSIKTRLADAAFGSGSSDLINSTEGVLYAEIAALANDNSTRVIMLSDGTNSNRVFIGYWQASNEIKALVQVGGVTQTIQGSTSYDILNYNKVAFVYKENDFSLWINGSNVFNDTTGITFPAGTLTQLDFDSTGSAVFFGKTKCVAVFKEALTDEELECLTTI